MKNNNKNKLFVASLGFSLSMLLSSVVYADMGLVINLAGKQRMLTQKMSKEALLIAKNIDVKGNLESIKKTSSLFDQTLKGLINGDDELGLDKTKDADITKQLKIVSALWKTFNKSIQKVASGDTSKATLNRIAYKNMSLLKEMNKVVEMYTATASDSNIDKKMATAINLAGRQRMLTQKMTKELLLVANDIDNKSSKAKFKKTAKSFEKTLVALVDGDKKLGLPKVTDKALLKQMDKVIGMWVKYKRVLANIDTSDDGLKATADINMLLLLETSTVVGMYEKLAKK